MDKVIAECEVEQFFIDEGTPCDPFDCAVSLAMQDATSYVNVRSSPDEIRLEDDVEGSRAFKCSNDLNSWISDWDTNKTIVSPIRVKCVERGLELLAIMENI